MKNKICIVCGKQFQSNKNAQKCCSEECSSKRKQITDKNKVANKKLKCQLCGTFFDGNKNNKYCSDVCRKQSMKNRKEKSYICVVCNKEFKGKAYSKYCSKECEYVYRKNNPRHTLECGHCKKEFQSNNKKQKYCSSECVAEGTRIYPDCICEYCGNEFRHRATGENKFCSYQCYDEYRHNNTGRYCIVCENELKGNEQKYCSDECKIKFYTKTYICEHCNKEYQSIKDEKYCSQVCVDEVENRKKEKQIQLEDELKLKKEKREKELNKVCLQCGDKFQAKSIRQIYCSNICQRRYHYNQKEIQRRHKMAENGEVDHSISLEKLYKRDKGICALCGESVNYKDFHKNTEGHFIVGKDYPSIDHIIPVAKGGTHTWDNIQLMHHVCNSIKGDRYIESGIEANQLA